MSELDCLSFESFVRKNSQQQMKSASSLSICKKNQLLTVLSHILQYGEMIRFVIFNPLHNGRRHCHELT